jgi:hypothetical protein
MQGMMARSANLPYGPNWPDALEWILQQWNVESYEEKRLISVVDCFGVELDLFFGGDECVPNPEQFPLLLKLALFGAGDTLARSSDEQQTSSQPLDQVPSTVILTPQDAGETGACVRDAQRTNLKPVDVVLMLLENRAFSLSVCDIAKFSLCCYATRQALTSREGKFRMKQITLDEFEVNTSQAFDHLEIPLLERATLRGAMLDLVHVLNNVAGRSSAWNVVYLSIRVEHEEADDDLDDIHKHTLFERALMNCIAAVTKSRTLRHLKIWIDRGCYKEQSNFGTNSLISLGGFFQKSPGLRSVGLHMKCVMGVQSFLHAMRLGGYGRDQAGIWQRSLQDNDAEIGSTVVPDPSEQDCPNVIIPSLHIADEEQELEWGSQVFETESWITDEGMQSFGNHMIGDTTEDGSVMSEVIQKVRHCEAARKITPSEAKLCVHSQWDPRPELRTYNLQTPYPQSHAKDQVIAVFFDRYTEEFEQAILASPLVSSLHECGIQERPHWANDAFVLVEGLTHGDVAEFRCCLEGNLARQHVFIKSTDLQALLSAVKGIKAWEKRPIVKRLGGKGHEVPQDMIRTVPTDDSSSWLQCSSYHWAWPARSYFKPSVQNTFINLGADEVHLQHHKPQRSHSV